MPYGFVSGHGKAQPKPEKRLLLSFTATMDGLRTTVLYQPSGKTALEQGFQGGG